MYQKIVSIALLFFLTPLWAIDSNSMLPPIDAKFRPRVDFWKRVYTEINSDQGFVHDKEDPSIIYRKVDFKTKNHRKKSRASKKAIREVEKILKKILQKNFQGLNASENEILKLSKAQDKKDIHRAIKNLRTQYGLKDNYYIGLKRSHRYLDYIKEVFAKYGLPKELVYLPHVESSFNYRAYSKVGAAGIWQFMRSTGRRFGMKINYVIDERRDPLIATIAAAKLLQFNYKKIQSWPLAITAYNHGLRSMERAVKRVKSNKISDIIEKYDGRRFGFASKNFYATFIATVEISENPQKYFPSFVKPPKFNYTRIKNPKPLTVKQILESLNIDAQTLKFYNPSIRSIAYRSSLQLPQGFNLQLPPLTEDEKLAKLDILNNLKSITKDMQIASVHTIRRGDSLYTLSKIYRVSIHDLIVFNQISNPSRIYPGMKIKIPGGKDLEKLKIAQASVKPEPVEPAVVVAAKAITPPVEEPTKTVTITSTPPIREKSWFDKIVSWYKGEDKDPAAIEVDVKEAIEEDKKSEVASKLVHLDDYDLDIKHLSGNLYEITIETDETLGHYSDWSLTRIAEIREANRMRSNSTIRIGQKLKLILPSDKHERFISQRAEYHLSIQEDFFQNFKINGTEEYTVKQGDSLSQILTKNEVPLWLFRKYQGKEFNHNKSLVLGQVFKIPQVEKRDQ